MAMVKGVLFVEAVRALRRNRQRALAELSDELAKYLNKRIVLTAWYPEEDFVELIRCAARVAEPPDSDAFFVQLGEATARGHHDGEQGHFFAAGKSVGESLEWVRGIWSTHHDSGRVAVTVGGETATVEVRNFPALCHEYEQILLGWGKGFLLAEGAAAPQIHRKDTRNSEHDVVFELSWQEP